MGSSSDLQAKLNDARKCDVEVLTEAEFATKYPGIDLTLV